MPRSVKEELKNAICLNAAACLTMDSCDEDEEDEIMETFNVNILLLKSHRRSTHLDVPKTSEWTKQVLVNFDDQRFRQMLRLDPGEFGHILSLIKDDPVFQNQHSVPQLPLELQLQIVLFRLGSYGEGGSIRKIATMFGVGDGGTIQILTRRVFKALLNLKPQFIYWPKDIERINIVEKGMDELPGCIGYIDGTEIKLAEAPARNHAIFYSRTKQYSIKMQAVCDHNLKIRHATIGHHGSIHDAKIFAESSIGQTPENFFSPLQWIAGDSAYPLSRHVITPFRKNSNEFTQESREKFNEHFSKYRVRIENCFSLLKEKFSSLKELKFRMHSNENHKESCNWIMVCCILHNILIEYNNQEDNSRSGSNSTDYPQELRENENLRSGLVNFLINKNL